MDEGSSLRKETKTPPWNVLIDRYLAGDEVPLFNQIRGLVFGYWMLQTKTAREQTRQYGSEGEDIFQDLFADLVLIPDRGMISVRGESDGYINAWLYKLLRNRLISAFRRTRRERELTTELGENEDVASAVNFPSQLERQEFIRSVESIISERRKPEIARRLHHILGLYLEHFTNEEMAQLLDVSIKTIENDKHQIKKIAAELNDSLKFGKGNENAEL